MIKGLSVMPPIVGRILIGNVIEKNGKRLPKKDDQFHLTTQVLSSESWVSRPHDFDLR